MRLTTFLLLVAACRREAGEARDPLRDISAEVRAGKFAAVAARIAAAPLPDRPTLAFRAVADAPPQALEPLAAAAAEAELATAVADRLEERAGPKAGLAARQKAVAFAPERAEHHDTLARAYLDANQLEPALRAWSEAAALAPLQPAYHLMPIRALVAAGDAARACARAAALAERAPGDVERLLLASNASAACGDFPASVTLAAAAKDLRPGDGRLVFTWGERLADAKDARAAAVLVELLACGAHGRPWHRHEVAGRLLRVIEDEPAAAASEGALRVRAALDAPPPCAPDGPPEPQDLAGYVQGLREKLPPRRAR